jgi:hypothetical protein
MIGKPIARPAKKPARAAVVKAEEAPALEISDPVDEEAFAEDVTSDPMSSATSVDNANVDEPAAETPVVVKKRASLAARRKTMAATMICASAGPPKFKSSETDDQSETFDILAAAGKILGKKVRPGSRTSLVKRVTKVIERELDLIEKIVGRVGCDESLRAEADRRARTLAVLVRTLIELKKGRVDDAQGSAEHDDRPRDLDELRQRLSERLARRLQGELQLSDGGHDGGRAEVPE